MDAGESLAGKVVGNYEIERELGRGGMGVVYRAHEQSLQRVVALKVLPRHLAEDPALVKRFLREARAGARLNHPNIVTTHAVGDHDGTYFIAMEYIKGAPLSETIGQQGQIETGRALDIVRQAAQALAAAHEQGIIHRDIKPQNLMIDQSGHVKVMDFGLAKVLQASVELTAEGARMGTPLYMSPEQANGKELDPRTDIYSLGVVLYEMLGGATPFGGDTPMAVLYQIVHDAPRDLRELNAGVSSPIFNLVTKMTAKDPKNRHESAEILEQDIRSVILNEQQRNQPTIVTGAIPVNRGDSSQSLRLSAAHAREFARNNRVLVTAGTAIVSLISAAVLALAVMGALAIARMPGGVESGALDDAAAPIGPTSDPGAAEAVDPEVFGGVPEGVTIQTFDGMNFAWIEPGSFVMGSPEQEPGRIDDEVPHEVTLTKGFWLGQSEVTQAQWNAVMGTDPSHFKGLQNPVEYVSWNDTQEFVSRLNKGTAGPYRLPTEAEWEYACRAGSTEKYSYGSDENALRAYGWFSDNAGASSHPVGSKTSNAWGLYDMHGNLFEWCSDWYGEYSGNAETNPGGPGSSDERVLRGGSWSDTAVNCRSAGRDSDIPASAEGDLGFRVVRMEPAK